MNLPQLNFIFAYFSWYLFNNYLYSQTFSSFPRLCAFHHDPSQYYPCVLNYIGLNSWSLYRCPDGSTFDEGSQQCLMKVPVSDTFEKLASSSSTEVAPFHRIASFIVATPLPNDDQEVQRQRQTSLVSLSPTIDKWMNSISIKRLKKRSESDGEEQSTGVIWSHGYPLMKLDSKPIVDQQSSSTQTKTVNIRRATIVSEDQLKYKKVCYFTNWSQYRPGPAKFEPENIDPFLCTHLVYAFAYIDNRTLLIKTIEDNDKDLYKRLNALKTRNTELKTLLGVGGWNMKSYAFSKMIHSYETRRDFIYNTINFLREHKFDGLEIDWEFPGLRGGQFDDKHYLTIFCQEFKAAAMAQSIITGQTRLLLSAAVSAEQDIVEKAYEIEELAKTLDFISILTYDFHGAWQNYTGLNAPLYRRLDEYDKDGTFNQDYGIAIWLKNGAPAYKLVLGVPLFARSFLLERADQNRLYSPVAGNGTEGPFTHHPGFLSYFEICLLQTDSKWQKRSVPDGSESEYMFKDRDWISYETLENIRKRAAYVVANNLGGMFIWSLDMDDFNGSFCNNGTYPYVKNSLALLPRNIPSYV